MTKKPPGKMMHDSPVPAVPHTGTMSSGSGGGRRGVMGNGKAGSGSRKGVMGKGK